MFVYVCTCFFVFVSVCLCACFCVLVFVHVCVSVSVCVFVRVLTVLLAASVSRRSPLFRLVTSSRRLRLSTSAECSRWLKSRKCCCSVDTRAWWWAGFNTDRSVSVTPPPQPSAQLPSGRAASASVASDGRSASSGLIQPKAGQRKLIG